MGNHRTFEFGEPEAAFEEADVVIEDKFKLYSPIETYSVIVDYDEAEDSFEKIVAKTDIPKHRLTERVILYNRAELDAWLMGR